MTKEKNIIDELWIYMDKNKNKNKIHREVYEWLNCDNLSSIIIDQHRIFYFKKTTHGTTMPNYIYEWLKKWTKKRYPGLTYLYDIPTVTKK